MPALRAFYSLFSRRRQFHPGLGGLEGAEKFFLLPDDRVRRGQLLFQSQAGLRLGEAEDALAVQQFDEVELDFIAINHNLIVRENCEIAISCPSRRRREESLTCRSKAGKFETRYLVSYIPQLPSVTLHLGVLALMLL